MKGTKRTAGVANQTVPTSLAAWQRYWLVQIPGLAVILALSAYCTRWFSLPLWSIAVAVAVWAAKDALLYPYLKASYEGPQPTGPESMVGTEGTAVEALAPRGFVRIGAELWRAHSAAPVAAGLAVRVTGCDGMTLRVTAADQADGDSPCRGA